MKRNLFISAMIALGAVFGLSYCSSSIPKGAAAVKSFDKASYLGKWYEIARLDYRFERDLDHVTATYSLKKDGTIRVDNRGYNFKTYHWEESIGKAKPAGQSDEGKLKVSFFGPFYAGYNVIALDSNYKYALVAGRNLDYIWFLSREITMPVEIKEKYLKMAEDLGYETAKLVWVDQSGNKAMIFK